VDSAVTYIPMQKKVSLAGLADDAASKVKSNDGVTAILTATVPLSDVDARKADGWEGWDHPESPLDFTNDDKETRPIERMDDVRERDKPYKDGAHFVKKGSDRIKEKGTATGWQYGQLFGSTGSDESRGSLSFSSFTPAALVTDSASATSIGHQLVFPRPPQVGLVWGGYDDF